MKNIVFVCLSLFLFFSCKNDLNESIDSFELDKKVEISIDNKKALNDFLSGIDFPASKSDTRATYPPYAMRLYYHPAGNCFPWPENCLPEVVITPRSNPGERIMEWEKTDIGSVFSEEVKKGNFKLETITNENGTFLFYKNLAEKEVVVQLR